MPALHATTALHALQGLHAMTATTAPTSALRYAARDPWFLMTNDQRPLTNDE
jgi:hypothetical protein